MIDTSSLAHRVYSSFPLLHAKHKHLAYLQYDFGFVGYIMAQSAGFAFEQRLKGYVKHVRQHEDPIVQTMAMSLLPQDQLDRDALAVTDWPFDNEIRILVPLVHWFKNEFFRWVDQPDCSNCNAPTTEPFTPAGLDAQLYAPTSQEVGGSADRIELFRCGVCKRLERFPRYNNPAILLETRRGRCGEWANCFYLFLRALGLTARFVVDWTDHVWCEVYSKSTLQWIHVDPCEAAIDKPLVYEAGWSKKLSYIIAFSNVEVVDVTWRYVRNRKVVAARRTEVSEKDLVAVLQKVNKELQDKMTVDEKNELVRRKIWELADMLKPRAINQGEKVGRQSGNAQWRVSRGEAKASECGASATVQSIKPNDSEVKQRRLVLSYNCALDKYERGDGSSVGGWQTLVWKTSNVFRKVERDWKMAYICRNEGSNQSEKGSVTWFIDLRGCNPSLTIKSAEISLKTETFAVGATIRLAVRSSDDSSSTTLVDVALPQAVIKLERGQHFNEALRCLVITVTMAGGSGQLAWQHAQLFRQSLIHDRQTPAFQLNIELGD